MNRPGGPEEYSPGREAGATDKQSDRGPEGRKIDSHNLTPLRGWVQNGSKTPAFGRGYILSALRAYSFTPSTRLNKDAAAPRYLCKLGPISLIQEKRAARPRSCGQHL